MTIKLHAKTAFINAVRAADNPIAFLLGSPLSQTADGGVPGVTQMQALVRDEILSKLPGTVNEFDNLLAGKSGEQAYQASMEWLQANLTQSAVNRVVRKAVMLARKPGAPDTFTLDGDVRDWYITPGIQQLAELVAREQEWFAGPILTTNFDPLLSLAIEAAGRRTDIRVIDSDGVATSRVQQNPGAIDVVHLHGYWRAADTLNTLSQLTSQRPRLQKSLQNLLRRHTLVVVAYGGWDDVFTKALAELVNDEEATLDVFWCFYESKQEEVEVRYKNLLDRVSPAITRGRFLTYGDINCHTIFAELSGPVINVTSSSVHDVAAPPIYTQINMSPLAGWEQIDSAYLAALPPLQQEEVTRYFDGAVPAWRHAVSDAIPRREKISRITEGILNFRTDRGEGLLQLIRAAGGEGKTTLLLQAAADIVRTGGWTALWRPSPRIELLPDHVLKLDNSRQWLIVADDAENLISDLVEAARRLHAARRSNVHFLLAARDADWKFMRGDNPPWDELLWRQTDILLRGIEPGEARSIVEAWQRNGAHGLRSLATLAPDERIGALETAVQDAARAGGEGSLLGGLLAVRFGKEGLRAHVRDFLERLKGIPIYGSRSSLFDSLLYVAACHGVGIPGIDAKVLAELVGVSSDWVYTRVVTPLGEEAAAVQSAGHVFTRHSSVAAAILVEAEKSFGIDLTEIWSKLVRQTVQTITEDRVQHMTFRKIVRAGKSLYKALPMQLDKARRKAIAIAAARAGVVAQPKRLGSIIDLGKVYRSVEEHEAACAVFRDNLAAVMAKFEADETSEANADKLDNGDSSKFIRSYWYTWSVCEGERGREREHALVDAWLGGISVSDHLNPAQITYEQGKRSCAGLGVAFGKLAEARPDCPYAKARRAVAYLGRFSHPDSTAIGYYNRYDLEADKMNTPCPKDIAEAIEWLAEGIAQADSEIQDPFLSSLAVSSRVSFNHLQSMLVSASTASKKNYDN